MDKPTALSMLKVTIIGSKVIKDTRSVQLIDTVKKDEDVLKCGLLSLDKLRHKVLYDNTEIELTNREFMLLKILMENKNIVLTRDVLMEKVCGYDYVGETNVIDVYIRYLRTKIDDKFNVKIITTVRGVGYVIKDE